MLRADLSEAHCALVTNPKRFATGLPPKFPLSRCILVFGPELKIISQECERVSIRQIDPIPARDARISVLSTAARISSAAASMPLGTV